jgi:serine/threonine-protein kinase
MTAKDTDPTAILSRLLDSALELPPERRMAWLDGLDAEELAPILPRLRVLVARSCSPDAEAFDTLPKLPPAPEPLTRAVGHAPRAVGSIVGPYRLKRRLGEGGMGTVWLAERTDGAPPLEVALKFAHVAPLRSDLQARLTREQQLLAALDHPNIARIYAGDVTLEGHPYLVLELVNGLTLDEYCRVRQPSTAERLQLFLQIARAVAHAHGCSIVHRDLKPANIMISDGGMVRLLDFGVGKLLGGELPPDMELSRLNGQPLTPAYASPEQLLGAAVGFASDVYSLGVILYELLTGERPYATVRGSNRALREAILAAVPVAPSRRREDLGLDAELGVALDAIVLEALRKQPDERYPSALELAAAVERALLTG